MEDGIFALCINEKGIAVYGGRVVHHNVHMRNNTSACIEVLSRREHIKYHANETEVPD